MKVILVCVECERKQNFELDLCKEKELGVQRFTCPNGHKNAVILLNRPYDIAFETGLERLKEKKYRQAVQEFNIALTKYYEFAIKMICSLNSVPFEIYESGWHDVDSRLERQTGAYIALYTLAFRQHAQVLPDELRKLRDAIMLDNLKPSYENVLSYAQKVYEIIRDGIEKIKQCEFTKTREEGPNEAIISYMGKKMSDLSKGIEQEKETASFQTVQTSLYYGAAKYQEFEQLVQENVDCVENG